MSSSNPTHGRSDRRWLLASIVWIAVAAALTVSQARVPRLAGPDSADFSGTRAMETLARLLPDDTPHPRGSRALVGVQDRLLTVLGEIGVEPEVQLTEACSSFGRCGAVRNILVHFPGETRHIVLVSAHTDSVPTGPGAGDDGQGVAILVELARTLKAQPLRNPVTLLFTDGEEDGLLGATAFVEGHPTAGRVAAAINLEARGQAGRSALFRTSGDSAWLIDLYARHAPSPFTSSVHQVVFDAMPHETDLTIWSRFGIPGVDFAFFDGADAYHAPTDTVALLDPGAVQSQGDNALAMLRGLVDADLASPPSGHAVWFDVMGLFVIRWPRPWTAWLCLTWTAACLGATVRARANGGLRWGDLATGSTAVLLTMLGSLLAGGAMIWLGLSHEWPTVGLALGLPWACTALVGSRRLCPVGLHLGAATLMTLATLPLVLFWPGIVHLLLLPPVFAAVGWSVGLRWPGHGLPAGALLGALSTAILWFPLMHSIRIALGPDSLVVLATGMALIAMWTLPLWRTP